MYDSIAYALDLAVSVGINGKKNGAAATAMPFPDGFVTEIVFHFAYKMFEGYTYYSFTTEVYRVLILKYGIIDSHRTCLGIQN